ncbi:hypothetical protein GCM10007922_30120 [Shewanella decolorationis]|nr:hypothetical protein GCM10007922_30120 [Shewanella decolorationis]
MSWREARSQLLINGLCHSALRMVIGHIQISTWENPVAAEYCFKYKRSNLSTGFVA